jgi:branched-chain amino acid transport system permease protein
MKSNVPIYIIVGIILLLTFTVPLWLNLYYVQILIESFYLGITAMSFILLAGYCGMISLAQMSFYTIAAYVIGIGTMDLGWPTYVLLPLSIAGAVFLSVLFGTIAIRARGIYFLMMTLALSQLVYGIGLQWESVTHGWNGIPGITRPSIFGFSLLQTVPRYYTTLIVSIMCYLILRRIVDSPFGMVLRGIRDNETKMSALGYNVNLYRFLALIISGAFAGTGGILGVYSTGVVSPHTNDLAAIVKVLLAALIGGISCLEGGFIGAIFTVLLVSITSQYTSRYWMVVGAVFMLVMMFLPRGLLGLVIVKPSIRKRKLVKDK